MGFKTIVSVILSGFSFIYTYADSTRVMYQNMRFESVHQAAFSPDDRLLLTASASGAIKLWDIASGKLLNSFYLFFPEPATVAFSPDGKKYIVCPLQEPAFVVETYTGRRLFNLEDSRKGEWNVSSFIWSPDGSKILGAKSTNQYRGKSLAEMYDGGSGQKLFTFFDSANCLLVNKSKLSCELNRAYFSPDGKWIILRYGHQNSYEGKHLIMLNAIDLHELYRIDHEFFENFSNNGSRFITTSGNIYETVSGKFINRVNTCNSLGFLPGDSIVLNYCSYKLECVKVRTKEIIRAFDGFRIDGDCHGRIYNPFPADFFAINGDKLFITRTPQTISEWNWKTGELIHVFKDTSWCFDFQLSHNKKLLLSFYESNIKIWSTENGRLLYNYPQWSARKSDNKKYYSYKYQVSSIHHFDKDKKRIYIKSRNGRYTKIDFKKAKIKRNKRCWFIKFPENQEHYNAYYSINDSETIEFIMNYNQLMISYDTNSYILNIWMDGKRDWLIGDSRGNYNANRAMRKKIYFVRNNTIIKSRKLRRQSRNRTFWEWDAFIAHFKN